MTTISYGEHNRLAARIILAGIAGIAAAAWIAYYPALGLSFYWDDWGIVERLSRLGTAQYVIRAFNPMNTELMLAYRPLQGLLYGLTRLVFGFNSVAFHGVALFLHFMNALWLGLICWQAARTMRLALLASVLYASLPLSSAAVFLINAPDVLATNFYLGATCFWIQYLRHGRTRFSVLTAVFFVMGLATKEFVITLPATLFLLDRLLLRAPIGWWNLVRRYLALALISAGFLAFTFFIQPKSMIVSIYRPALGPHMLSNALWYLNRLTFPWYGDPPVSFWLPLVVGLLLVAAIWKKSPALLFLAVESVLGMLHVLLFQWQIFDIRHLYLASVVPAVVLALLVERGVQLSPPRWRPVLALAAALGLLLMNVRGVDAFARDYADRTRAERTQFRDISQAHPQFPEDTYLYLIDPPITPRFLTGMFIARYGDGINVGSTEDSVPANLRQHRNTLIYYFAEYGKAMEIKPEMGIDVHESPTVPATFEQSIHLDGYELSARSMAQGDTLALLLYWRGDRKIDQDYTIFVHLVDSSGNVLAGVDNQPRNGTAPTSTWMPGAPVLDYLLIPIEMDVPSQSDYALEIGLYDLETMRRLSILDERGTALTDRILIRGVTVR